VFFLISKFFWFFARPLNLLYFSVLGAMLLNRLGRQRLASIIATVSAYRLCGDRIYAAPRPARIPARNGGPGGQTSQGAGYHLGESGDRLVKGSNLAKWLSSIHLHRPSMARP
jgi:hypothetical protein